MNHLENATSHYTHRLNFNLGALETKKIINLYELCEKMKKEGYEYASFIPEGMDVLKGFKVPSSKLGADLSDKPTHSIYFSKLESLDSENFKNKIVPAWFNWLHDVEHGDTGKIERYENSNILFAKLDKSRICEVSDILKKSKTAGLDPLLIKQIIDNPDLSDIFSSTDYASKRSDFDGVHANAISQRDFIKWGVETIAVWCIACINEMKCYKNSGSWSYDKKTLFHEWGYVIAHGGDDDEDDDNDLDEL